MEKCNKFKEYFLFFNEEQLNEHIANCPDCKAELEQFDKISNLVKEVSFAYRKKRKNKLLTKVACISGMLMFTASLGLFNAISTNIEYENYNNYLQDNITEEMGYPIDSYGLIKVD